MATAIALSGLTRSEFDRRCSVNLSRLSAEHYFSLVCRVGGFACGHANKLHGVTLSSFLGAVRCVCSIRVVVAIGRYASVAIRMVLSVSCEIS